MKLKELYKKWVNWIVVILLCLYGMKSCQSCSRERRLEFNEIKYEIVIDSLTSTIYDYKEVIRAYSDTINIKNVEIEALQRSNDMLKGINRHFQSTNRTLINTNRDLTSINKEIE